MYGSWVVGRAPTLMFQSPEWGCDTRRSGYIGLPSLRNGLPGDRKPLIVRFSQLAWGGNWEGLALCFTFVHWNLFVFIRYTSKALVKFIPREVKSMYTKMTFRLFSSSIIRIKHEGTISIFDMNMTYDVYICHVSTYSTYGNVQLTVHYF